MIRRSAALAARCRPPFRYDRAQPVNEPRTNGGVPATEGTWASDPGNCADPALLSQSLINQACPNLLAASCAPNS